MAQPEGEQSNQRIRLHRHWLISDDPQRTRTLTQAVEAERSVIKEVADVARLRRHGAEGVRAAGGEGVNADEQHVHQQRPGVAVRHEVQSGAEDGETPQEVPANNRNVAQPSQNDCHGGDFDGGLCSPCTLLV